jgi:hypothetical protein
MASKARLKEIREAIAKKDFQSAKRVSSSPIYLAVADWVVLVKEC